MNPILAIMLILAAIYGVPYAIMCQQPQGCPNLNRDFDSRIQGTR